MDFSDQIINNPKKISKREKEIQEAVQRLVQEKEERELLVKKREEASCQEKLDLDLKAFELKLKQLETDYIAALQHSNQTPLKTMIMNILKKMKLNSASKYK
jgi:hypothetical protein